MVLFVPLRIDMLTLRPFQRRAVRALESGRYDVVCLSTCRAQGKSTLAASLCMRALTPGDPLFRTGTESHLVAATISQSRRTCFKILRRMVESSPDAGAYKIAESLNVCHVRHRPSNTRVSVVAGSAKSTLGLVGCPLVVVDEPGSYELEAGAGLWDSLSTAVGKPESALQVFVIGHLAPRATAPGHWYFDLVNGGTRGRTWVHLIAGRADRWDQAGEIRRCSPLSWAFPASRAKLLEERDQARGDSRLKARFLSYRLNVPAADEATMLLTTDDWERTCARPVPPRAGRPVVGVDLGGGRSWSAAVALWRSGRVEAVAVAPGIPSVADQERRDSRRRRDVCGAGRCGPAEDRHGAPRATAGGAARHDPAVGARGRDLRQVQARGAARRGGGAVQDLPARHPLVRSIRGYPRRAEVRGGWAAVMRAGLEGAARGVTGRGDGQDG